jgi:hypothetical protein
MPTTVTNVYELPQGEYSEGQQDSDWRAVRSWVVELSEPDGAGNGAEIAKGAQGIPAKGALYPDSSNARFICQRIAAKLQGTARRAYRVEAEYGISNDNTSSQSQQGDITLPPWQRAIVYDYSAFEVEEDLEYDFSETPKRVLNSAGDLYDSPLTYSRSLLQISVERAKITYARASAGLLVGTTNNGSVTIDGTSYAVGTCKLIESSARLQEWSNGGGVSFTKYWAIRQTIIVRAEGWDTTMVSRGWRYRTGTGELKRCYDIDGDGQEVPSATAKFLSASGMQIDIGSAEPHEETYKVLPGGNWGPLELS